MIKLQETIFFIAASAFSISSPALAQQTLPEPGGYDTPGQVAEMARVLCEGDAYTGLGYSSYSECYSDIVTNFQPAGSQGNPGSIAFCQAFTGKTGIPCFG